MLRLPVIMITSDEAQNIHAWMELYVYYSGTYELSFKH